MMDRTTGYHFMSITILLLDALFSDCISIIRNISNTNAAGGTQEKLFVLGKLTDNKSMFTRFRISGSSPFDQEGRPH